MSFQARPNYTSLIEYHSSTSVFFAGEQLPAHLIGARLAEFIKEYRLHPSCIPQNCIIISDNTLM